MDCFNDFCIACDKESHNGGAYCSQACRLADMERANMAESTSPRTYPTPGASYYQPSSRTYTSKPSSASSSRPQSSYFSSQYTYDDPSTLPRALTPSSSRSSLSSNLSTSSSSTSSGLSDRAKAELQSYYNSFDKVREAKRRSSTK